MKVFFFGNPAIAVPSLEALTGDPTIEVVGVGVFPDKKVGRKQILTPCPVKEKAQALGLDVFEITQEQDLRTIFQDLSFDVGVVIAFGMIFPGDVLDIPPLGVVNVHFSLLPKYRGASPVQSAILQGDTMSGITLQRMVEALDEGNILLQEGIPIKNKSASEMFEIFAQESARLLPNFLRDYPAGKTLNIVQAQSPCPPSFCKKFVREDGAIDPQKETAESIYQKFLAFDIFPGIFLPTAKGDVKLLDVALEEEARHREDFQQSYHLVCKNETALYLFQAQIPGKKPMSVPEILKGNPDIFA